MDRFFYLLFNYILLTGIERNHQDEGFTSWQKKYFPLLQNYQ
jgi:hypothetical protein